jgi:TPP-dependent trihydroxycyclohexane-1,2-dione (THcHDO) dehydratase
VSATETPASPAVARPLARRRIGVGVIGFGWLGQAHSRSLLRIPTLFADRTYDPVLVACSDTIPARVDEAVSSFRFARASLDWRTVVDDQAGRGSLVSDHPLSLGAVGATGTTAANGSPASPTW